MDYQCGDRTVTRFPAAIPSKVEIFKAAPSGKGMAIDSKGNAWITNTGGNGFKLEEKAKLLELKLTGKSQEIHQVIVDYSKRIVEGNITTLRPDGNEAPAARRSLPAEAPVGPLGCRDRRQRSGLDFRLSRRTGTHLCGTSPETCPPGMKMGDPIPRRADMSVAICSG